MQEHIFAIAVAAAFGLLPWAVRGMPHWCAQLGVFAGIAMGIITFLPINQKYIWPLMVISLGILCTSSGLIWFMNRYYNKATPDQALDNLPVIAIDCRPAPIPGVAPASGLNYIDFKYQSQMIGVASYGPGQQITWPPVGSVFMPLYCEFTIHDDVELYDVTFMLHVTFHEAIKRPGGQIENGALIGESNRLIRIPRINNNLSFGFYAFTTGDYIVSAAFPEIAQYVDGQNAQTKVVRLLTINWKALGFPPAKAFSG